MKVIGITGHKQVGKDTVYEYMKDNYMVWSYAFARPVYELVVKLIGDLPLNEKYEIDKGAVIQPYGVTLRHMLQTLGTEWGRNNIHGDIWVMKAREWIDSVYNTTQFRPEYLVFTDVRFLNEANYIRELGGSIIEIDRLGHYPDGHASEAGLPKEVIDHTIMNHGDLNGLYANTELVLGRL